MLENEGCGEPEDEAVEEYIGETRPENNDRSSIRRSNPTRWVAPLDERARMLGPCPRSSRPRRGDAPGRFGGTRGQPGRRRSTDPAPDWAPRSSPGGTAGTGPKGRWNLRGARGARVESSWIASRRIESGRCRWCKGCPAGP